MTGLSCLRLNSSEKTTANANGGKSMVNPAHEVHANHAASEASGAQFNVDRRGWRRDL